MHKDDWLSEILGYSVFEVTDAKDTNLVVQKYHEPRSLTYAKVPVDDIATVSELTGLGFRVAEVSGWFGSYGLPASGATSLGNSIVFAEPAHHAGLLNIAGSCFNWSRFHRDALTMPKANWLKREWLRNCLEGRRGLEVLVALNKEKRPVGFLAVGEDGPDRVVDLLGVSPGHQGCGIGRQLVIRFRSLNSERTLGAGTSLANAAAVRLYQSCGFKLCSTSYVLHLHRGV